MAMKMKTQDTVHKEVALREPKRTKRRVRLATIGAILVVALIVGASALVFAQLSQQHRQQQNAAQPPSGSWVSVLQGYTISSLLAAENASGVLYACATPAHTNNGVSGQPSQSIAYTVLRSSDFGSHWQDVGSKAALGESCRVAINPTNSNDIFASGLSSSNGQTTAFLRHSSDGGQTWSSITPTLKVGSAQLGTTWNVQYLSFAGNALFGTQWFTPAAMPNSHPGAVPRYFTRLSRLVMSTDGGQTWTIVDAQFATTSQGVSSYAVDPSNSQTIYDLVSTPWWPIQPIQTEPADILPAYGVNGNLYKTTDGGANWQLLLKSLPFGAQVRLASGQPQTLYVGGRRGPLPYVAHSMPGNSNSVPNATGNFSLQMSSDGGSTWRNVAGVPQAQASLVQSWFVDANGQVFINISAGGYSTSGSGQNGEPTASTGTATAATPVMVPPTKTQTGVMPSISEHVAVVLTTAPPNYPPQAIASIQRYNATSNTWREVTKPPTNGTLLTVTPGDSNASDVLWYVGTGNGGTTLYRFVV